MRACVPAMCPCYGSASPENHKPTTVHMPVLMGTGLYALVGVWRDYLPTQQHGKNKPWNTLNSHLGLRTNGASLMLGMSDTEFINRHTRAPGKMADNCMQEMEQGCRPPQQQQQWQQPHYHNFAFQPSHSSLQRRFRPG